MDVFDTKINRRLSPKDGSIDVLADRIAKLKQMIKQDYEKNYADYDRRDYQRFMDPNDDWYARRWIIYQRDPECAFEMAKDAFKWRKSIGLNDAKYEEFPREFYESGCVFEYGKDKIGRPVIYIRGRLFRPMTELTALYDKFFAFMIDQCDKKAYSKGFTMVYDLTDAGLSNVEMSTLRFMTSLRDRFPLSARQILIAALPWVLTPVFKLIMSLIPPAQSNAIKSIHLNELNQYINEDAIPSSMGGTCKLKFQLIPSGAKPVSEFHDLPKSVMSKLKKHVESKIDPSDCEVVNHLIPIN
ncbi:Motile sperm domain-containing protein 2 [Fragariocoptes setiger]|uniref:Motile sperm domain-containing protein 2 n=1 Tax=Fragariocoptes setiger TaxID=1670756 RepID=A0ABQ7SAJ4_9ACAR|nr:Motile sperm domain-containing protein 2 [Fragariocoptes setiger]